MRRGGLVIKPPSGAGVVQNVALVPSGALTTLTSGASGVAAIAATTPGNQLMMAVFAAGASASVSSITDSAGNTWALVNHANASTSTEIWHTTGAAPLSATSVTITWAGAVSAIATFLEVAGLINVTDASGFHDESSTAATSGAATPATANDFALATIGWDEVSGATPNPDTGGAFTAGAPDGSVFSQWVTGGVEIKIRTAWKFLAGTPSAQTFSTTLPALNAGGGVIALIKP